MTQEGTDARLDALHQDMEEIRGLIRWARNALVAGFVAIIGGLVMAGMYMERLDQTRQDVIENRDRIMRLQHAQRASARHQDG